MNPDEPTKEEVKDYRRMAKQWLKRKNLVRMVVRLSGEFHQIMEITPNCINKRFRDDLIRTPKLVGWRKEIWSNFRKTTLKKFYAYKTSDAIYNEGAACAFLDNMHFGYEQLVKSAPRGPSLKMVLEQYTPLDAEEKIQVKLTVGRIMKTLAKAETRILGFRPSEKKRFALGESENANAIYGDYGEFSHGTDATKIYNMLLLFGDYVDTLPSRMKIFRFLKILLDKEMPHDFEAFTQICKRIGLKGTEGRERDRKNVEGSSLVIAVP